MSMPAHLRELAAWADAQGAGWVLDLPIARVRAALKADVTDPPMLAHLIDDHRCRTLRAALQHPSADACLEEEALDEEEAAEFVTSIATYLARCGDRRSGVPLPPHDFVALQRWAAEHGVLERLDDAAPAFAGRLPPGLRQLVMPNGHTPRVMDFLSPTSRARGSDAWQRKALADAARAYLLDAARARYAQRALEARARTPSEPSLRALDERLSAARVQLGKGVVRRPIGTYEPRPAELAENPVRFVYIEPGRARVEIVCEEEPLVAGCSCGGVRCDHVLAAIDAALDLIRDPLREAAQTRLASTLGTPAWSRFLFAFGDGLAKSSRPNPASLEEARLGFRIKHASGSLTLEAIVQKARKRGGFSAGQKIAWDTLAERPDLTRDPRDARVLAAMTEGLEETGLSYWAPSRTRLMRALAALVGHPRVYLAEHPDTPARVEAARLRLLLEPSSSSDDTVAPVLAIRDRRFRAAELRAALEGTPHAILVDGQALSVYLVTLDERARLLVDALERFPARFPPESHDELLRLVQSLQESVEVELPEALRGEPIEADRRLVVRLGPVATGEGTLDTQVAIFVRPVEGGPVFEPGEGPAVVLHTLAGRRVAAQRALAEEPAAAKALAERLPLPQPSSSAWTWRLAGQESVLDLVAALRDLGDEVVVEWPEPEKRIDLASATARTLKLRVTDRRDWFGVEGEIEVDGATVSLASLLAAVRAGRRYVEVGPRRFAAIEDELRRKLATAADVVFQGRRGLEVSLPGAGALAELVDDPGQLEAASRFRDLVARIDAARALAPALPEGFTAELRPYQREGFLWLSRLAAWGMGACLADDMGLGKTVQALALLVDRAALGPALVIAPTSVGPNWLAEAARFAPRLRVQLYRGAGRGAMLAELGKSDVLVTSYGLATRDAEALGRTRFATLILDEAQAIKNALTRRARAVRDLDATFRVALTGTPVENHLGELWSLMRILAPGLLGSWDQFRERFAIPIERARDPERRAGLARALRPFLLRRTKAEVAPELPPRTEIARLVERTPAERRLYDEARRAAIAAVASGEGDARFVLLAALTKLRRLACHPRLVDDASAVPSSKLAALLEIVRELRETGSRALVFSQFTSHLALVREALDAEGIGYAYLDGATPSEERTRRIAAFQAGEHDLFLISLKAGGTGLNLTAADTVIHLDPWWNPAVEDQATDRAHRIGQTRAVTVVRLIAQGTIEEAVLALHGDKRALAAGVFDEEGSPARLSADDLAALIRAGADAASDAELDESTALDALGEEIVAEASEPTAAPPRGPILPPARAPLATFADKVLDHLAARRRVADRRYDGTLRAYERSLRRFTDYLASNAQEGAFHAEPGPVIDGYLDALRGGRVAAPASEPEIARTVLNHVRAFLADASRREGP